MLMIYVGEWTLQEIALNIMICWFIQITDLTSSKHYIEINHKIQFYTTFNPQNKVNGSLPVCLCVHQKYLADHLTNMVLPTPPALKIPKGVASSIWDFKYINCTIVFP